MESISKRTGKKFTGKFAGTAIRLGLAMPSGDSEQPKSKAKVAPKKAKKSPKKAKK